MSFQLERNCAHIRSRIDKYAAEGDVSDGDLRASFRPAYYRLARMVPYQRSYSISELISKLGHPPEFIRFAATSVALWAYREAVMEKGKCERTAVCLPLEWREWLIKSRDAFNDTDLRIDAVGDVTLDWLFSNVFLMPSHITQQAWSTITLPRGLITCGNLSIDLIGLEDITREDIVPLLTKWLVERSPVHPGRLQLRYYRWPPEYDIMIKFIHAVRTVFEYSLDSDFPTFIAAMLPYRSRFAEDPTEVPLMEQFELSVGAKRLALELWSRDNRAVDHVFYCCHDELVVHDAMAQHALTPADVETIRQRYQSGEESYLF